MDRRARERASSSRRDNPRSPKSKTSIRIFAHPWLIPGDGWLLPSQPFLVLCSRAQEVDEKIDGRSGGGLYKAQPPD